MSRTLYILFIAAFVAVLAGCQRDATPQRALTAQESRGQLLYESYCSRCHHPDSTSALNGPGLKGMYKKQYLSSGAPANDERVRDVIKMGKRMMPGYGSLMNDPQIDDLIAYLHTL